MLVEAFVDQLGINRYSLYLMDYGAPIGFRLAAKHPERVQSLIVQNGNAYEEGLRESWDPIRKRSHWPILRTASGATAPSLSEDARKSPSSFRVNGPGNWTTG